MKIRTGRLRRLAKHLRGTHRAHKKFSFSILSKGKWKKGKFCGSAGCAIGELPALWPKEWTWELYGPYSNAVVHKSQLTYGTEYGIIARFFSITVIQVEHLFVPNKQIEIFGEQKLDRDATPEQVADNIDIFIKKMA